MEFSIGTMAQSTFPVDTASMVSCMEPKGRNSRLRPLGDFSSRVALSASSVNVPAGPRKPTVVAATGNGSASDDTAQGMTPGLAASQATRISLVVEG